jgi:uncharacterized SAM-binding protein YcdF (DUF218 family)
VPAPDNLTSQEGLGIPKTIKGGSLPPEAAMDLTAGDTEITRQILLKRGVPDSAIVVFGNEVSSAHEEALALRNWLEQTGSKKIIIVSDPFHTRRVRWLFRKELATTGAQTLTDVAPPLKYTVSNWWQTHQGLIESKRNLSNMPSTG